MKLRNLSGRKLASIAGVHYTMVYRIASGTTSNPNEEDLNKLASALNVSPLWLRSGIGDDPRLTVNEKVDPYTVLGALANGEDADRMAAALEALVLAVLPLGIGPDGHRLNEVLQALIERSKREEKDPTKEWALEEMAKLNMRK